MRNLLLILFVGLVAACSPTRDLGEPAEPIGNFELGQGFGLVAKDVTKAPASRDASEEDWKSALGEAINNRFSRFSGGQVFHVSITVDGYMIAPPGVPLVLSPKSVLIFRPVIVDVDGNVMFDENGDLEQITVIESFSAETALGSGLTLSREEQIKDLAEAAARATENWMRKQDWFDGPVTTQTPQFTSPAGNG